MLPSSHCQELCIFPFGLIAIGFVANTEPTPEVVEGISSIISFTPAIACILSAGIFYFGYRLEDKGVLEMEEEISGRFEVRSQSSEVGDQSSEV